MVHVDNAASERQDDEGYTGAAVPPRDADRPADENRRQVIAGGFALLGSLVLGQRGLGGAAWADEARLFGKANLNGARVELVSFAPQNGPLIAPEGTTLPACLMDAVKPVSSDAIVRVPGRVYKKLRATFTFDFSDPAMKRFYDSVKGYGPVRDVLFPIPSNSRTPLDAGRIGKFAYIVHSIAIEDALTGRPLEGDPINDGRSGSAGLLLAGFKDWDSIDGRKFRITMVWTESNVDTQQFAKDVNLARATSTAAEIGIAPPPEFMAPWLGRKLPYGLTEIDPTHAHFQKEYGNEMVAKNLILDDTWEGKGDRARLAELIDRYYPLLRSDKLPHPVNYAWVLQGKGGNCEPKTIAFVGVLLQNKISCCAVTGVNGNNPTPHKWMTVWDGTKGEVITVDFTQSRDSGKSAASVINGTNDFDLVPISQANGFGYEIKGRKGGAGGPGGSTCHLIEEMRIGNGLYSTYIPFPVSGLEVKRL